MSRALVLGMSACLLLGAVDVADEQADGVALVDKALKAIGPDAAKIKAAQFKSQATFKVEGTEIKVTMEAALQGADQAKFDANVEVNGATQSILVVINKDKAYAKAGGNVNEIPADAIKHVVTILETIRIPNLLEGLKAPGVRLSPLGELVIEQKPALGVNITRKDKRDVSLWFDKETGLPVRVDTAIADPQGMEHKVEFGFHDWKPLGKLRQFTKLTGNFDDGKQTFTLEITEPQALETLDEGTFAKP